MSFRRLARPTTPPELAECGWQLARLPGGHWWCIHAASETETHIYTAPGPAIEEAWHYAEPDHELLLKRERERRRARSLPMTRTTDGRELTPDEAAALVEAVRRLVNGTICIHCGADVEHFQQVGRSYYAEPCRHRQGQGSAAYFNQKIAAKKANADEP
jgi:hypothetical protein